MSRLHPRHAGLALSPCLALLLGSLTLNIRGQDPAKSTASAKLFFLVRVTNNLTQKDVKETLEEGAAVAKCTHDPIRILQLHPDFFRQLGMLAGLDEEAAPPRIRSDLDIQEKQMTPPIWELLLAAQVQDGKEITPTLVELEVNYTARGKVVYKPISERSAREGKKTDYLSREYAGKYTLYSIPRDEPRSCEATIILGAAGVPKKIKKDWSRPRERIYAITLPNFQGDRQKLFETVKEKPKGEKNLVANPFSDVELGQDLTFTLAAMGGRLPGWKKAFGKNKYTPEVSALDDRTVRRVWMLFPLNKESLAEELKKYKDLEGKDLSEAIRKTDVSMAAREPDVEVSPASKPRWIELVDTGAGGSFSRPITLKDVHKLPDQFPKAWQILVWEFDNGLTPPQAIRLQDDRGQRAYLKDQEVEQWSQGIQRVIDEQKPPK